jgi:hypothetical protein
MNDKIEKTQPINPKNIIKEIDQKAPHYTNDEIIKIITKHLKLINNKFILDDLLKEVERLKNEFNEGIILYNSKFNTLSSFIGIIFTVALGLTFYINQNKLFNIFDVAFILYVIGLISLLVTFSLTILSTLPKKYTVFDEMKLIEVASKHNNNKNNYIKEKLLTLFYSSILNFNILNKLKSKYKPITILLIITVLFISIFGSLILFNFKDKNTLIYMKSENLENINDTIIKSNIDFYLSNINVRLKEIGGHK